MSTPHRIGIYAGAFDPIHDGHLEVARDAVKYLELDKLVFMVEEKTWTDKKLAPVERRRTMVRLGIKKDTKISLLKQIDKQFTISSTLPKLEVLYPSSELFFIMGADVFLRMTPDQWPDLHRLLKHYIVVFERAEIKEEVLSKHAVAIGAKVAILPSAHQHHSSTDIRMYPKNQHVWLPVEVAEYIRRHNLYQSSSK
jgi:nicotinate-nucleotide adenylyltransferase